MRFSSILHPTSNILHPTSSILHPTSNILHPTSSILHPTSSIMHPTSSILHPTSYPIPKSVKVFSSRTVHIDILTTFCPLITKTLRMISVRCIPLSLRSKTRRRATLLLPTWICSCQSVGTVNFALPFTTTWRFQSPYYKLSVSE